MSSFATRLRELRAAESQASFSAAIGVNRIQYAKYEAGKNSPSIDILERICRIHACSADWLLGLREHGTGAVTVKGNGNAVANGSHAIAISGSPVVQPGTSALCRKCPHLKKLKSLEKAFAK